MMHKKHNIDLNSMINKPKNPITCCETLWQKNVHLLNSETEENSKII